MRAKRVPVLPTDMEKDESEIMHMTIRSQCDTEEDSHKCSPKEPLVTMDRGSFAHDVYTDPVLIQRIHSAAETCEELHESSETRAVNGVLENLDTCGLGEVSLKRDVGSAIRTLVDPARVGRGERTMTDKCSNGMSGNVKSIETPVTTSDCVLPEWSGCKVDSDNIALSWTVGCAVHVLSQSEKRKDDHNVRVWLRTRESRAELTQTCETVNLEDVGDEVAKLDPSKTTETSLDRTDEDGERLPQRRTARTMAAKRIHKPHKCAQESKRFDGRADDRQQEELHLKVPHPKIRRDGRLLRVLGSLIATHVRTTRKSRPCSTVTSVRLLGRREGRRIIRCFREQRELMRFTVRCPRSCRSCVLRWR